MHRPNPSTRDGACAYCNVMEDIKSNADSAGFAETVEYFVVSLEKLNYMEKRMMNQHMRAHECVRMLVAIVDEFRPEQDSTWLVRQVCTVLSDYMRAKMHMNIGEPLLECVRFNGLRYELRCNRSVMPDLVLSATRAYYGHA